MVANAPTATIAAIMNIGVSVVSKPFYLFYPLPAASNGSANQRMSSQAQAAETEQLLFNS